MSRKLASEFRQPTPAKPKTLPSRMANEISTLQSGPAKGPLIATFAIEHCSTPERRAVSSAISTAGWRKFVQRRDRNPGPAAPRERSNSDRNRKRAISNRKSGAGNPLAGSAPSALFFSKIAPYIGGAGSPAMEINDRRNKPFGPGGSTRRLHQNPLFGMGFGGGEPGSTRA